MNKNEILEKSRNENKKTDPYEMEVIRKGNEYGMAAGYVLCAILFIAQYLTGTGLNYGLFTMLLTVNAVSALYNALKLKEKKYVLIAACYGFAVLTSLSLIVMEMVS